MKSPWPSPASVPFHRPPCWWASIGGTNSDPRISHSQEPGSAAARDQQPAERPAEIRHLPCAHRCTRHLLCSHECREPCSRHKGTGGADPVVCPPCKRECEVACVHTRCNRVCSDPCAACAEACSWECEHQVSRFQSQPPPSVLLSQHINLKGRGTWCFTAPTSRMTWG